jgi:hypothetical protein
MKLSFDQQAGGRSDAVAENNAAVTRLTQLLNSSDPQVRAIAAVELGGMGPKARQAMSDLAPLASDPDRHVRFAAVRSMTQIDPEDRATVPALVLVANDPQTSSEDRKAALGLLADMGPSAQSAIPALERMQNGDDAEMRIAARTALSRIDLNRIEPTNSFGPMPVTSRLQSQYRPATQPATRSAFATQPRNIGSSDAARERAARDATGRLDASPAARIERPTTGPATGPDTLPKPDLRSLGIAHYSPQQLQAVRDWIARQKDLTDAQKREHVVHFEQWNRDQLAMVRDLKATQNGNDAELNK